MSQPVTDDNPRMIAYRTLAAVTEDDAYANLVLPRMLDHHRLPHRDAAFATELAYGSLRLRGTLDAIISKAARRDLTAIEPAVLDVLRLGAYQLLRTRVAHHAAVDTSVSLARTVVGHRVAGFVNAVLRKVAQRDAGAWLDMLVTGDDIADLGLEFAHPTWVVERFDEALGGDESELIAALGADNDAPAVHLCARPGRIEASELAARVDGHRGDWSPYAVYMPHGSPGDVDAVRSGAAHVQDEGSQLMAAALVDAPLDGSDTRWLDLCAGPGGKAGLLGAVAATRGAHVTAVEVSRHRADLVTGATRGLPVEVVCADGREFTAAEPFDRVLVDAPCTGLGALRRRPEARWRKNPSDVARLVSLQRELLAAALRLVRQGGVVAYVTCSPVVAETDDVVAAEAGAAELLDFRKVLPGRMEMLGAGPTVRLWPHRHGTDAMFGALLLRR